MGHKNNSSEIAVVFSNVLCNLRHVCLGKQWKNKPCLLLGLHTYTIENAAALEISNKIDLFWKKPGGFIKIWWAKTNEDIYKDIMDMASRALKRCYSIFLKRWFKSRLTIFMILCYMSILRGSKNVKSRLWSKLYLNLVTSATHTFF